ncbi:MAG: hypothetical protein COB96_04795 [Planctomycetota bacterium]|nr:MAG: hypothetical protein COB96_04795 [Planctomycetota bacterium]
MHLLSDLADASIEAVTAIRSYTEYLRHEVAPKARGSFRLGRENFDRKLELEEGVTLGADRLLAIAQRELRETQEEFQAALAAAEQAASAPGALVTFGIRPTHPATGYGYIRRAGSAIAGGIDLPVWAVDSFTEKPDAETAQRFVDEGIYFWNSGIFAWRADTILSAIAGLMPKLAAGLSQIRAAMVKGDSAATVAEVYPQLESIPIDVGVMEKSNEVLVIEAPFTWRDIGSWGALYDYLEKDENGNAVVFPAGGQLVCEDAANILAYSNDEQTIAVLGLDNVVVVRTKDALLVASRDRAEDVKLLVDRLRRDGREDLL